MTCPNSQWFMEGRVAVMASKGVPQGQFCRRLLKSMHCLRMCGASPIHFPDVLVFRSPGFQLNDGKLEAQIYMSTRIIEKAMQVIIIKILWLQRKLLRTCHLTRVGISGSSGHFCLQSETRAINVLKENPLYRAIYYVQNMVVLGLVC